MSPPKFGQVLVVDDETELMSALVEALTLQGYEADGFVSGKAALEALERQSYDLVLTDLMMPEMDGIALLKAGLKIDPHLVGVVMTGHGTVPTAVEAMKVGAFDYILKPFKMTEVLPVLARAREVRRLRLENIQLRETVAIYNLSQTIAFSLDSKLVLENSADAALQQTEADEVSIMLLTPENRELYIAVVRGRDREHLLGQHLSLQEGIAGWVARQSEPLILNGEVSDARFAPIRPRAEIRSAISMPMRAAGKLVGVLNVNSLQSRRSFTPGQIKALSILTSTAAAALENEALYSTLEAREKHFRALIENSSDAVTLLNPEGRVIYTSASARRVLGYAPEELAGQNAFDLIHPDDRQTMLTGFIEAAQKPRQVQTTQLRVRHKDGAWLWIEGTAQNLLAEPGVEAVVVNYRDITERRRADEKIENQLRRLSALRAIDMAITSSLDLRITLNVLLEHVIAQLRVDATAVLLLNRHLNELEYAAGRGFRGASITRLRLKLGEGYASQAALERRTVSIPNLAEAERPFTKAELTADEKFVALYAVPLVAKGQVKGVLEVFHRARLDPDPDWLDFLETLAGQAAIAIDDAQLFDGLQRSNIELALAYDATIEGWSRAMDLRDKETEGHTQRVTELTLELARAAGMSDTEIAHVRRGALLHDMGKLGVPDSILLKPDKLTDEEWVAMRKHPQHAYDMLSSIHYLRPALDIPYCHHEKWDGTGYPHGLKGEQIPLAARLFAVVDVWDALRSDRPYRAAWPEEKVLEHVRAQAGTHFDPKAVELFFQVMSEKAHEPKQSAG
ncbi:MAG TPA: HD domain-containing phosphohydrolase [Anaerolineales bacterium]|nr:HD domain-containing phosphohydrolase [Anaerolineales bacterium]